MTYKFHKAQGEASNIDGCVFTNGVFITNDPDKAELMRNYGGFGKTVFEIKDEELATVRDDYSSMPYEELLKLAQERGLTNKRIKKAELIALLEG